LGSKCHSQGPHTGLTTSKGAEASETVGAGGPRGAQTHRTSPDKTLSVARNSHDSKASGKKDDKAVPNDRRNPLE